MKYELVVNTRPKSNISEDIRTIRTNLQFSLTDEDIKTILITSAAPGDGKSFISSNLAVAFAQTGAKVLLIDTDLRLGEVHKVFKLSNTEGFSNLLATRDIKNAKDCAKFILRTGIDNLYVITRGTVPPNPSELLDSNNAKLIVNMLRKSFDYIIFDGVPINGLSDSLVTARYSDRVVLVCSINRTDVDELEKAKKSLENINAKIAGVVVNRTSVNKRGKYSNYYE